MPMLWLMSFVHSKWVLIQFCECDILMVICICTRMKSIRCDLSVNSEEYYHSYLLTVLPTYRHESKIQRHTHLPSTYIIIEANPVTQAMTNQHQTNDYYPLKHIVQCSSYDKIILDIDQRRIHHTMVNQFSDQPGCMSNNHLQRRYRTFPHRHYN